MAQIPNGMYENLTDYQREPETAILPKPPQSERPIATFDPELQGLDETYLQADDLFNGTARARHEWDEKGAIGEDGNVIEDDSEPIGTVHDALLSQRFGMPRRA
ncbi:MAG: hypothetical protein AAF772_02245 [Acidobacteriota bacterium]